MSSLGNFIFWRQPFSVTGPAEQSAVVTRLRTELSSGRFSMRDRLVGSLKDTRLLVWKKNLAGYAGDIVEFDGVLRADNAGTVIEGTLQYRMNSKIQFITLLLTGLFILVVGALQKLHGADGGLLAIGGFITGLTLFWIYSGSKTKYLQIQFIEDKLKTAVSG